MEVGHPCAGHYCDAEALGEILFPHILPALLRPLVHTSEAVQNMVINVLAASLGTSGAPGSGGSRGDGHIRAATRDETLANRNHLLDRPELEQWLCAVVVNQVKTHVTAHDDGGGGGGGGGRKGGRKGDTAGDGSLHGGTGGAGVRKEGREESNSVSGGGEDEHDSVSNHALRLLSESLGHCLDGVEHGWTRLQRVQVRQKHESTETRNPKPEGVYGTRVYFKYIYKGFMNGLRNLIYKGCLNALCVSQHGMWCREYVQCSVAL